MDSGDPDPDPDVVTPGQNLNMQHELQESNQVDFDVGKECQSLEASSMEKSQDAAKSESDSQSSNTSSVDKSEAEINGEECQTPLVPLVNKSEMDVGEQGSKRADALSVDAFGARVSLTSHVNQGRHLEALSLFHHMQTSPSLTLDAYAYPLVLKSCSAIHRPQLGSSIHAHATKSSLLSNSFVACALVDMYGKCFSISFARKLFDEIPQRNVVVWNSMISIYTRLGLMDEALHLFHSMDVRPDESTFNSIIASLSELEDGRFKAIEFYRRMQEAGLRPNLITLLALLPACVGVAALASIKEIHGYAVRSNIEPHPQLRSGLVEAYGRSIFIKSTMNYESGKVDKGEVAGAAADLLDAASHSTTTTSTYSGGGGGHATKFEKQSEPAHASSGGSLP
ncbi:hypothetical protein CCACVL1_17229 [Corchorus capsularis]|uniref:Pentatricopeptide repeat-containing protein n=1 Tax=Corchorus capsularis TaxID=210143 RepID=A0A1R3HT31_COCAP|nr:hypothetical protein CCACVL1_17229 [Corchorus capsularis]